MAPLTLADIAAIIGGTLLDGDGARVVRTVSTDSRTLAAGDLFIAIRGDTHDGHDKLDEVAAKCATAAIVERSLGGLSSPSPLAGEGGVRGRGVLACSDELSAVYGQTLPPSPSHKGRGDDLPLIHVVDTRRALAALANHARRQLTKPKVIAIAGSNGKTTTKNLLHAVLSTRLKGTASPKSFNNDIGVPATLLPVDPNDDYVIVEIGTNHPGEIAALSLIAEPDLAIITSIGEEHLEFFGDLAGVRAENAQIVAGLRASGPLIVTGDDPELDAELPVHRTITRFGLQPKNDLRATQIRITQDGTHFCFEEIEWHVPLIGAHFAACGLAVIHCARWMGLCNDDIRKGLSRAAPSTMRMQRIDHGPVTVLNDAYNANPTSMRAALTTAAQIAPPRRLVLVLGEMGELGDASAAAHQSIHEQAGGISAVLITVGPAFQYLTGAAHWFPDSTTAAPAIAKLIRPGDIVLLKGSRSVKLERVADAIASAFAVAELVEAQA